MISWIYTMEMILYNYGYGYSLSDIHYDISYWNYEVPS